MWKSYGDNSGLSAGPMSTPNDTAVSWSLLTLWVTWGLELCSKKMPCHHYVYLDIFSTSCADFEVSDSNGLQQICCDVIWGPEAWVPHCQRIQPKTTLLGDPCDLNFFSWWCEKSNKSRSIIVNFLHMNEHKIRNTVLSHRKDIS
jgi:hypothetical protein